MNSRVVVVILGESVSTNNDSLNISSSVKLMGVNSV